MATPCTVSGTIRTADGTALTGVAIDFYGDAPQGVGTADILSGKRVRIITGPNADNPAWAAGFMSIDLSQGNRVRLRSAKLGLDDLVITIPATATANFSTLIEAALA